MEETGIVLDAAGGTATVRMTASPACEGCGQASLCHPGAGPARTLRVQDPVGVRPGQRHVGRDGARQTLDTLNPWPLRLDAAAAARAGAQLAAQQRLALAEVVVFSDLQATAWTAGPPAVADVLVWRAPPPIPNRSIDSAFAVPKEWRPNGQVIAFVGGDSTEQLGVRLTIDGREVARAVAVPGDRVGLAAHASNADWSIARVDLDPDELRLDDQWWLAVHGAPPAAVRVEPGAGTFVAQALSVLTDGGRVSRGNEVVLADRLTEGITVVFPPADPALIGVVNRALAARGSAWRFGARADGEWVVSGDLDPATGASVFRRHHLAGSGTVWARAGGEPWIVADSATVIVASRMEPAWTDLPVRAGFVPFMDLLVNRVAARPAWIIRATPGTPLTLPPGVRAAGTTGRMTAPFEPGVYFLTAGADTVGALEVNHDRRESRLAQADLRNLQSALGDHVRLLDTPGLDREVFGGAHRASLAGALLVAAFLAALAELLLSAFGQRGEET